METVWKQRREHNALLPPDLCEQLVFLLEFLIFGNGRLRGLVPEDLVEMTEKGALYRAYLDLRGLNFIEQLLYTFQKFTEYNDRMVIVDEYLLIERHGISTLARVIASTIYTVFEGDRTGVMVLVRVDSALISCCKSGAHGILLCSVNEAEYSVAVAEDGCESLSSLAAVLMQCLEDLGVGHSSSGGLSSAEVACLLPVRAELSRDLLDDALTDVAATLKAQRQVESRERILGLRAELADLRLELEEELSAPEYAEQGEQGDDRSSEGSRVHEQQENTPVEWTMAAQEVTGSSVALASEPPRSPVSSTTSALPTASGPREDLHATGPTSQTSPDVRTMADREDRAVGAVEENRQEDNAEFTEGETAQGVGEDGMESGEDHREEGVEEAEEEGVEEDEESAPIGSRDGWTGVGYEAEGRSSQDLSASTEEQAPRAEAGSSHPAGAFEERGEDAGISSAFLCGTVQCGDGEGVGGLAVQIAEGGKEGDHPFTHPGGDSTPSSPVAASSPDEDFDSFVPSAQLPPLPALDFSPPMEVEIEPAEPTGDVLQADWQPDCEPPTEDDVSGRGEVAKPHMSMEPPVDDVLASNSIHQDAKARVRRPFHPLSQSVVDALSSSPGRRGPRASLGDGDPEETLAEYAMSAYQLIKERVIADSVFSPYQSVTTSVTVDEQGGTEAQRDIFPRVIGAFTDVNKTESQQLRGSSGHEGRQAVPMFPTPHEAERYEERGRQEVQPHKDHAQGWPAGEDREHVQSGSATIPASALGAATGSPRTYPDTVAVPAGTGADTAKAALADKLLALRLLLDNEDICAKARKNQRRVEIGRIVLDRLMSEGASIAQAAQRGSVAEGSPLVLRDLAVGKSGISFVTAAEGGAPASGKPSQRSYMPTAAPPAAPLQGDTHTRAHRAQISMGSEATAPLHMYQYEHSPHVHSFENLPSPPTAKPHAAEGPLRSKPTKVGPTSPQAPPLQQQADSSAHSARAQSAGRGGRKLSNYPQVKNAINTVCMAGAHFDVKRAELLDILEHFRFGTPLLPAIAEINAIDRLHAEVCQGRVSHFLILFFQSKTLSFKSVYASDPSTGALFRIFGKGPKELSDGSLAVQQYLKFETSSKTFKQLHVKSISSNVDAVVLDALAFKSKA